MLQTSWNKVRVRVWNRRLLKARSFTSGDEETTLWNDITTWAQKTQLICRGESSVFTQFGTRVVILLYSSKYNFNCCSYCSREAPFADQVNPKCFNTSHVQFQLYCSCLFFFFLHAMILWSRTHLPSPLSNSITFLIATVTTFDLYQGPAHSISCCYSLLLETSCLCRAHFLFPLTARIRAHRLAAWPALLWIVANALKQWGVWICGWVGPAIKHLVKTVCVVKWNCKNC